MKRTFRYRLYPTRRQAEAQLEELREALRQIAAIPNEPPG